jgi:outer membrane receptor protein involved in Fe transport
VRQRPLVFDIGNSLPTNFDGLPAKTYVAQSGPDVLAHTIQSGVYAQDEWRINPRLTLSFGLRWQALPPFVSPLTNLTFDQTNGGVIVPDHNVPVQGFLESINACSGPYNPYGVANPALPCGPIESASSQGLGPGVRTFYKRNFQPRIGFAYRPFGNDRTVIRGGLGIFTMTNLGIDRQRCKRWCGELNNNKLRRCCPPGVENRFTAPPARR